MGRRCRQVLGRELQNPVKEEKLPAKTSKGSSAFDETTTQYLKKFRSINSELVAAHQDLYRYNNPDKSNKGINLDEILNQEAKTVT